MKTLPTRIVKNALPAHTPWARPTACENTVAPFVCARTAASPLESSHRLAIHLSRDAISNIRKTKFPRLLGNDQIQTLKSRVHGTRQRPQQLLFCCIHNQRNTKVPQSASWHNPKKNEKSDPT